jgi:LuxR family transcriptional regulator, maltose regulon positive regulatory protein
MVTGAAARSPARSGRQGTASDDPVLTSKITVPGVPSWAVPRPRIDNLIAQGARRPLTLVAGPAGAGKTMALALWADAQPGAIAWVTLDDYDNRPKVFWSYVMAALRRAGVALPRALSATARGYGVDHVFLLRFASAMAVQDPPVTLVLDDLHVVTEPKVLDGLGYVLRNAGPGLHLMASSRMDPLLPLHRYRLSGHLTEIRTDDLVFSVPETRLLMAQHGITLSAESLECLTRRAEGWAAGLRLAAISMAGRPDPDQFIKELAVEDSAVTGYLVEEVLDAQSAPIRDFLLRTSILDRVSADIASELADDEPPPGALPALARTNAFVLPVGHGWYRYHSLFAAVLRLKLRRDFPDQVQDLHRRAARWYRRNGSLTEAVRHAADAGDWQFAARTVVDELVVGQLIEPRGNERLADEFRRMALGPGWTEAQSLLVAAAIQFSHAEDERSRASLGSAESMLEHLPDDDEVPSRLAATLIRLALSRRTGDLRAAMAAATKAEVLLKAVPEDLMARHPGIRAQVLSARGAVEFWSGHLDQAAATLKAGVLAACAPDSEDERADCLGHLALLEALQGRLRRAAELAAEATGTPENDSGPPARSISPAAEVALACVHLERNELSLAHSQLKRADAALRARPDKLISVAACLVAGRHCLAEGRARVVSEIVGRARHGWTPPSWLDHRLKLLESRACAAMSDIQSAVDTATSADPGSSLDAAVALAHAWLAAGDSQAAADTLASVSGGAEAPDWVRLEGWLVDAQISYGRGDRGRGRRSLEHALRLGEPEQLRLPFAIERTWIRPVLRSDPDLAHAHRRLLEPDLVSPGRVLVQKPGAGEAAPLIVEQLSGREREVLRLVSTMLSTAEMAAEMYISVNTVKSHLKSIYRKLAVTQRGEAVRRARQLELL